MYFKKDEVIAVGSILHKMEPEVATKALEQLPQFAATT